MYEEMITAIKELSSAIAQQNKLLAQNNQKPEKLSYTQAELRERLGFETHHQWYRHYRALKAAGMVKKGNRYFITEKQLNAFLNA